MKKYSFFTLLLTLLIMVVSCKKGGECHSWPKSERGIDWDEENSVEKIRPILTEYPNLKKHIGDTILIYGYYGPNPSSNSLENEFRPDDGCFADSLPTCHGGTLLDEPFEHWAHTGFLQLVFTGDLAKHIHLYHPMDKVLHVRCVVEKGVPFDPCWWQPDLLVVDFYFDD